MRELYKDTYNTERYSDVNMLYKNELIDTVTLSKGLTHLWGRDSQALPLLSLTEGQGGISTISPKKLNDTQYTWNVVGRMKHTSPVVALLGDQVKPGLGHSGFEVVFEDDLLLKFYGATTPDKQHQVRIQRQPIKEGEKRFRYYMTLITGDATEFIDMVNFQPGQQWVMTAPTIAPQLSDGTSSNSMAPSKWTNQFGFNRFSKQIAGNIANKVTNIEFDLDGGGTTNMWMPWEMRQFEIERRLMLEEDLWNSTYNRDKYGMIHLLDDETGEAIPRGAGIKEILKTTGQYDTYSMLTIDKLDGIINKLFGNRVDTSPMELVMITGSGGMRMVNYAIKLAAQGNNYYEKLGSEEVMSGKDGWLSYGKYFNQYKTIDGHIITFKPANLFNHGLYAELDRRNGNMYDGFPDESYNIMLLDMSNNDDGERNIQLVAEEGREIITGIYKGPTNLPGSWGAAEGKLMSTKKDEASYEVITSQGINMKNYTTSYWLQFIQ